MRFDDDVCVTGCTWDSEGVHAVNGEIVSAQVWLQKDDSTFMITSLNKITPFASLSITFSPEECCTLSMVGGGKIYLTGYYVVKNNAQIAMLQETTEISSEIYSNSTKMDLEKGTEF